MFTSSQQRCKTHFFRKQIKRCTTSQKQRASNLGLSRPPPSLSLSLLLSLSLPLIHLNCISYTHLVDNLITRQHNIIKMFLQLLMQYSFCNSIGGKLNSRSCIIYWLRMWKQIERKRGPPCGKVTTNLSPRIGDLSYVKSLGMWPYSLWTLKGR